MKSENVDPEGTDLELCSENFKRHIKLSWRKQYGKQANNPAIFPIESIRNKKASDDCLTKLFERVHKEAGDLNADYFIEMAEACLELRHREQGDEYPTHEAAYWLNIKVGEMRRSGLNPTRKELQDVVQEILDSRGFLKKPNWTRAFRDAEIDLPEAKRGPRPK